MKVTESLARSACEFLKYSAFHDYHVPRFDVEIRPLRKAWGYYYSEPRKIQIARAIRCPQKLLMVCAHEMAHAVLDKAGEHTHNDHGEEFRALGGIICKRMGWCAKEF